MQYNNAKFKFKDYSIFYLIHYFEVNITELFHTKITSAEPITTNASTTTRASTTAIFTIASPMTTLEVTTLTTLPSPAKSIITIPAKVFFY